VYRWDFDDPAREHFASLSSAGQEDLATFMNAAVLVDPIEYQRPPDEWSTRLMTSCSSSRSLIAERMHEVQVAGGGAAMEGAGATITLRIGFNYYG